MRVTLFNWLAPMIEGTRCLDLFAGSGALGFEAASRGAASVTLVERDPAAVRGLQVSREKLGASCCEIVRADALRWLSRDTSLWDVVFLDPPFDDAVLSSALEILAGGAHLNPDARVYIEFRRGEAPDLARWVIEKTTRAGESSGHLLRLV
jgi:16S rRNA (guanine966-N2)-methyltransferase